MTEIIDNVDGTSVWPKDERQHPVLGTAPFRLGSRVVVKDSCQNLYRGYVMVCIGVGGTHCTLKLDNGNIVSIANADLRKAVCSDYDVLARVHAAETLDVATLESILIKKLNFHDDE